ncbi:Na+/H+ antiporter subunit E [Amylibacter sp. IMCC11727]|uniref:Na+/H+ antiporter subunit E n=1 Tax=Amylibacter sp. IMCC11727 TaxID=3039851 RepID=UPI00244D9C8C|nr:Na+/H+ antiporter subunit E [Amylibacter sp. IMCC11727]WGI23338.1 Na+/H+ antiporter subunit E [Amylibacter sp. IMCC11727]
MRTILSALTLFALWLLMSGIYKPLVVWLGLASAIIAVLVVRRMDIVDGHRLSIPLKPLKFITYLGWLMKEIAVSNIAVTKLILSQKMGLRQHLFRVPNTQRSELAATVYANSITLTPGTITVEIDSEAFWVHAASFDDATHDALADMDARVSAIETGRR